MNNSSTGGYLQNTANNDLNDQALAIFLQGLVVGITGMPGNLVRPRWQAEPPSIPDFGTDWAAIGSVSRERDPFAYVKHTPGSSNGMLPSNPGSDTVIRNRTLQILCSFYGPNAEANSEIFAMGLEVPQNREAISLQGFNLVSGAGRSTIVPELTKQRWLYRVDIPFTLRQQQQYTFSVYDLLGAQAVLVVQDANITQGIAVDQTDSGGGYGSGGYGENPYGE